MKRMTAMVSMLALALLLVAGQGCHHAPAETVPAWTPSAESILDKQIEMTGGKDNFARIENRVMKGKMKMPAQGIEFEITVYSARPNLHLTIMDSPMVGMIAKGTDGTVAWQKSMMTGAQLLKGAEKTAMMNEAIFDRMVNWRDNFSTTDYQGEVVLDAEGKEAEPTEGTELNKAYKITMTPVEGTPFTLYMDTETFLPIKLTMTMETQMGSVPMEVFSEDYRDVDGLTMPFKARVVTMGTEVIMDIESIEQNAELKEDLFDLPDEIKALVDKE